MDRIQVDHVSKRYRLGQSGNLRETLRGGIRARRREELWSLRDVSFTVADGEALGIIGRNGAGKSTVLKLLMRITVPTEGEVRTRGRVAALLEVGTGFHPELTGRENVFLSAAVLGMTRAETRRRFDEIVDFAGTERFLDTPVKRYSSGMYLRLAFAVAAHLEPDVLIVDEVLAVGDAEFQRKCLGRMGQAEAEGRTVVFVSHDLTSLSRLCSRALWLDAGRVVGQGSTPELVRDYLTTSVSLATASAAAGLDAGDVALLDVRVVGESGARGQAHVRDDPLRVEVDFEVRRERPGLDIGIHLTNARNGRVLDESLRDGQERSFAVGRHRVALHVPPVLNRGEHTVGVWIGTALEDLINEPAAVAFELHGSDLGRPDRAVVLGLPFTCSDLDPS